MTSRALGIYDVRCGAGAFGVLLCWRRLYASEREAAGVRRRRWTVCERGRYLMSPACVNNTVCVWFWTWPAGSLVPYMYASLSHRSQCFAASYGLNNARLTHTNE